MIDAKTIKKVNTVNVNCKMKHTLSLLSLRRYAIPALLIGLLLFTVSGWLTGLTGRLRWRLDQGNQIYLDASIRDAARLMIPVGTAKAAADAIEGSTVNIEAGAVFAKAGMSIEAGDTLQPLLDYIDLAWRLLMISLVYLVTAKCVLAGTDALSAPFLVLSFSALLAGHLFAMIPGIPPVWRQAFRRFGALFLMAALLFLLILPLTVAGTAYLSRHTTDPMREEVRTAFEQIGSAFSMEQFHAADELKDKALILKEKLASLGEYARVSIKEVAMAVCKLVAIKILNGLVFPLASFAFLVWLVRGCLWPAFGLSDRPLSPEDFRRLATWLDRGKPATHAEPPTVLPTEPAESSPGER
ncbi:MAG TPA: hypothetical protein P5125_02050 [Kiritimatiellia bacterium]|jgi:hypothetical protein|nr:hypothetical protein [Kiritimatiellia bacterium]HPW75534.1 hypothetical protein [Kiritimatiellia bacterium]HRU19115.1 hypothetical protein [Kiritimatiellia bacterium]